MTLGRALIAIAVVAAVGGLIALPGALSSRELPDVPIVVIRDGDPERDLGKDDRRKPDRRDDRRKRSDRDRQPPPPAPAPAPTTPPPPPPAPAPAPVAPAPVPGGDDDDDDDGDDD